LGALPSGFLTDRHSRKIRKTERIPHDSRGSPLQNADCRSVAMPENARYHTGVASFALVLALASCDKGSERLTPTGASPTTSFGIIRLELLAPPTIAPGESVQLTANAVRSDGSVENVSSQAKWTAQSIPATEAMLGVTGMGVAIGGDRGRGVVTARFAGFTADATILVLPNGTFRLAGRITDGAVGLQNVNVAVIAGVGSGLTARTDVSGDYELYGVAGPVQIRASKDGYLDRIEHVDMTTHASLAFELAAYSTLAGR
jgi:hypothetical protein